MFNEILIPFILILMGIYGLCTSKNIIKSIICLNIMEISLILFFLSLFDIREGIAPILPNEYSNFVDPLPQALVITAIVIGASVTALSLMLSIKIFHYYGTLEWKELLERDV
ncbi:MAG: sodium:proton antiporter [Bacillota bacterium]